MKTAITTFIAVMFVGQVRAETAPADRTPAANNSL